VFHFGLSAALEHARKPHEIDIDIAFRVVDGVTHASLGDEVHDHVEVVVSKELCHTIAIRQVQLDESEVLADVALLRKGLEVLEPVALELRVVLVVEVVDTDDRVVACQQHLGQVKADKAGTSR
jgi:hypothetical protein